MYTTDDLGEGRMQNILFPPSTESFSSAGAEVTCKPQLRDRHGERQTPKDKDGLEVPTFSHLIHAPGAWTVTDCGMNEATGGA